MGRGDVYLVGYEQVRGRQAYTTRVVTLVRLTTNTSRV